MASNVAASASPKPLATMTKLSQYVSIYEPTTSALTAAASAPKLILLGSWMDARDLHIAKYITRYQTIYPASKILLVKFVLKHIVWESECAKATRPAVSYLRSQIDAGHLSASPAQPEILVHLFSNGGIGSARAIILQYEKATGQVFPRHTAVYDSCPGLYSYSSAYSAGMAGVPKGIWRWIMAPVCHFLNIYLFVLAVVLRRPYNLLINSDFHNDSRKVDQANRTYIYGKKDAMVEFQHVELHADQAEAKGLAVRREVFEDGTHVAHMRVDEARYWKIVQETWESAIRSK